MVEQASLFGSGAAGAGLDRTVFSGCGRYRYFLRRSWDDALPVWLFIGANPSKAGRPDGYGGEESDPTISGQVNRAKALGYGTVWAVNVRSWVSTEPSRVPADPYAIGSETDTWITRAVLAADLIVCAWGHLAGVRGAEVLELIRRTGKKPHALALTADGTPRHPRGVPSSARPFPLEVAGG